MDHPDIFYWARTAAPGRPACCSEVIALDAQRGTFMRRDAGQSKKKIISKPGVMFLVFFALFLLSDNDHLLDGGLIYKLVVR